MRILHRHTLSAVSLGHAAVSLALLVPCSCIRSAMWLQLPNPEDGSSHCHEPPLAQSVRKAQLTQQQVEALIRLPPGQHPHASGPPERRIAELQVGLQQLRRFSVTAPQLL